MTTISRFVHEIKPDTFLPDNFLKLLFNLYISRLCIYFSKVSGLISQSRDLLLPRISIRRSSLSLDLDKGKKVVLNSPARYATLADLMLDAYNFHCRFPYNFTSNKCNEIPSKSIVFFLFLTVLYGSSFRR